MLAKRQEQLQSGPQLAMLRAFRLQTRRCMLNKAMSLILIPWAVAALSLGLSDSNLPPGAHVLSSNHGAFGLLPGHMSRQPSAATQQGSFGSSSSKPQHVRAILARQDTPAQPPEVGPRREAAAEAELTNAKDPTQRDIWDAEPSYSSHYSSDEERPNMCRLVHQVPAPHGRQPYNFTAGKKDYVPYVGTSVTRDSQLMLLRLYYSIDYPVKWFVVVVGKPALAGRNPISYEVKHLLQYPQDKVGVVIISCDHQPAVSESWNAVFQTFKDEPWGVYMARDTFWERGALEKLTPHGWEASESGSVDVGYVKWSNMGQEWGQHNGFMMTSKAIRRFGLFDENIYPAYCEDWDMMRRVKLADPPLKEHTYFDVLAVHGKRTDTSYYPGGYLPDDPNVPEDKENTQATRDRHGPNCQYFLRKWGCPSEAGNWYAGVSDCRFKTPFNTTAPHWYWHTSKALRRRDKSLIVKTIENDGVKEGIFLLDTRTDERILQVPEHYGTWNGYFEKTRMCRLSGYLGRLPPDANGRTMCL